nr:hypothetical protein CFP56_74401 [Quercus suber]
MLFVIVSTPFRALCKLMEFVSKVTSRNPISSVHSTANSIAFASTLSADSGAGIFLLMAANAITCSQLLQITSPMPDTYVSVKVAPSTLALDPVNPIHLLLSSEPDPSPTELTSPSVGDRFIPPKLEFGGLSVGFPFSKT